MIRKVLGVSLLLLASPVFAGDLSYSYVQLGYQFVEIDNDFLPDADIDGDGFAISGSFEFTDNWFAVVGYSNIEFDFDVDTDQFGLGVGYHVDISDNADAFATLSYVSAEVSAPGFGSVDEDGFGFTVGVRAMVAEQIELSGSLGYVDLGDAGDNTTFGASALYSFTENFAAGALIELDDDVTAFGFGGRFYFGM